MGVDRGVFVPGYAVKPHGGGAFFSAGQAHRQGYGHVPGGYGPYDANGGYLSPGKLSYYIVSYIYRLKLKLFFPLFNFLVHKKPYFGGHGGGFW